MAVDIRAAFAAWRAKYARRAWKPVCGAQPAAAAQFGGSPVLAAGDRWPVCNECDAPMQLFLQMAVAELPAGCSVRGDGVLQLFYCSVDDGSCDTWRPFSGSHVVRLLRGTMSTAAHPAGLAPLPLRGVERWEELVDFPHPEEHGDLGLAYAYDFPNKRVSVSCDELGVALRDLDIDLEVAETIAVAEVGDKLGGWPAWVQGVEYPDCSQCGRRMDLVFQLDSENNVPHMFGDAGCGHLTQCPDHPEVLAFGWACS